MATKIGSLVVDLAAEFGSFRADMQKASRSVAAYQRETARATNSIVASFAGVERGARNLVKLSLAGLGLNSFKDAILGTVSSVASLGDQADKIGFTTDALQRLRYAFEQNGVGIATSDMALQRFARRVAEAAQGTGELQGTLEQYGIATRDAQGDIRDTEDVLGDLAETMSHAPTDAEALRIAFKAFDSEGAALVNTLRQGKQALTDLGDQAPIIAKDLIRSAQRIDAKWKDLVRTLEVGVKGSILELVDGIDQLISAPKDSLRFGEELKQLRREIELSQTMLDTLSDRELNMPAGPYTTVETEIRGKITTLQRRDPDHFLSEMQSRIAEQRQKLGEALAGGGGTVVPDSYISELREDLDALVDEYNRASDQIIKAKAAAAPKIPVTPQDKDENDEAAAAEKRYQAVVTRLEQRLQLVKAVKEEERILSEVFAAGIDRYSARADVIEGLVAQIADAESERTINERLRLAAEAKALEQQEEAKSLIREVRTEEQQRADAIAEINGLYDELVAQLGSVDAAQAVVAKATDKVNEKFKKSNELAEGAAGAIAEGLGDAAFAADDFAGSIDGIAESIARMAVEMAAIRPLENALSDLFGSIDFGELFDFSGGSGGAGGGATSGGGATDITLSAHGNAFDSSGLVAFAHGGVVDSPTQFWFGAGRRGLMGEAGPEGILPLDRGPGGALGVRAVVDFGDGQEQRSILPLERGADGVLGVRASIDLPDIAGPDLDTLMPDPAFDTGPLFPKSGDREASSLRFSENRPRPSHVGQDEESDWPTNDPITAFARGGIVDSPTAFAFDGDRPGLMGEAGPEAILPLERGADGVLGVRASIDLPDIAGPDLDTLMPDPAFDTGPLFPKSGDREASSLRFSENCPRPSHVGQDEEGDWPTNDPITAFARGGIVDSPTAFAFDGDRPGLMGEAGPEAILPLERGADGVLGVRASIDLPDIAGPDLDTLMPEATRTRTQIAVADQGVDWYFDVSLPEIDWSPPDIWDVGAPDLSFDIDPEVMASIANQSGSGDVPIQVNIITDTPGEIVRQEESRGPNGERLLNMWWRQGYQNAQRTGALGKMSAAGRGLK